MPSALDQLYVKIWGYRDGHDGVPNIIKHTDSQMLTCQSTTHWVLTTIPRVISPPQTRNARIMVVQRPTGLEVVGVRTGVRAP